MKNSPVRARPSAKPAAKSSKNAAPTLKVVTASPRATQKPKLKPASQAQAPKVASKTKPKIAEQKPAAKGASRKTAAKAKSAKPAVSVKAPSVKAASVKAATAKAAKSPAPKKETAKATVTKSASAKVAGAKPAVRDSVLRATKKRAPKDLAIQYGEKIKAPRATAAKTAPRRRRDAAMRAKLQQVIAPDDGLLLRLARAGAISSSLVPEGSTAAKPLRATKPRRSRKWETRCGKCGVSAQYTTLAALCVKCGAILVRD